MPRYLLLLGSNQAPEAALERACQLIEQKFGILRRGAIYTSPDRDGTAVPNYLNLGVETASILSLPELKAALREIEVQCGRIRPAPVSGLCAMDVDIVAQFTQGAWQVLDQKAIESDYGRASLGVWLVP